MPHQDIKLKKFNMNMIKNTEVCVFIGKRNTGKSFCLKDLLYYHRDIPMGTVISSTEEANRFFSDFIPPLFIHGDFNQEILENFIQRQKMMKEKKKKIHIVTKN